MSIKINVSLEMDKPSKNTMYSETDDIERSKHCSVVENLCYLFWFNCVYVVFPLTHTPHFFFLSSIISERNIPTTCRCRKYRVLVTILRSHTYAIKELREARNSNEIIKLKNDKGKSTKRQTTEFKTQHRKLKTEQ